jgi:hypothetical protein
MEQEAVFILFYCNIPLYVSDIFCIHQRGHAEVGSCPINGHLLTDFTYHGTETHGLYQWL